MVDKHEFYWLGELEDSQIHYFIDHIIDICEEDPKARITIWLNNTGGPLILALAFFDFIKAKNVNLTVIANGMVASGGILILAAGRKRLATENCSFFIHPPYRSVEAETDLTISNCDVIKAGMLKGQNGMCRLLATVCGKDESVFHEIFEKPEYTFNAREARRLGLVERVIKTVKPSK